MQPEAIDKFGNVRPFRRGDLLADGERLNVPLTFMDANTRAVHDALASKTQPRYGFRRGYAFADALRASHDACEDAASAYDARSERLQNAWRKDHQQDGGHASQRASTLDELRTAAEDAYRGRSERLANAWRTNR
jgi:hypothetical protein